MAQPVWVLSVDLQTKTATFQTGMAEAARSARTSFQDIKTGAKEMGAETNYSMMEARHGVMMLGEEFGIKLPRAVAGFLASIGPVGAAMEAAFPFLAIAALAGILIERLAKMHEAGEHLTSDQMAFGTAAQNVFNQLNDKTLQAQIRIDELRGNHVAKLRHELELIDHQSLNELVHSFEELSKEADKVMKDLEGHWYTFTKGSDGAAHALKVFGESYNDLLAHRDAKGASGLLDGTAAQAQHILDLMKEARDAGRSIPLVGAFADPAKYKEATAELAKYGITMDMFSGKQIAAQEAAVKLLNDEQTARQEIADDKKKEDTGATLTEHKKDTEAANKHGEEIVKYNESINKMIEEEDKQSKEGLVTREHESVQATVSGSQERLAAINTAIQEEIAYGRVGTVAYKALIAERLELTTQLTEQDAKLHDEGLKQHSAAEKAAAEEHTRNLAEMAKIKSPKGVDNFAVKNTELQQEYAANHAALLRELADAQAMEATKGTEKIAAVGRINAEIEALDKKHTDQLAENAAAQAQASKTAAMDVTNDWAQSLLRVAEGHESMKKMAIGAFDSIISNSLRAALMEVAHEKTAQLAHAEAAAAAAFHAMAGIPVIGPALGAAAAAATFAGAMAFESGGVVPGVGRGDIVPARLSPGEGIVPNSMMDHLNEAAKNGGFQSGPTNHVTMQVHMHASALDSDGMDEVLTKHADKLHKHFEGALRRMNK